MNFTTTQKLLIFTAFILMFSSCASHVDSDDHFSSFKKLRRHLEKVPAAYKPAPLWIWNGTITKRDIDLQLSGYKEMDFGGAFIAPEYVEYMECQAASDTNLLDYARRKARRLGLDLRMIDENGNIDGFNGISLPVTPLHGVYDAQIHKTYTASNFVQQQPDKAVMVLSDEDSIVIMPSAFQPQWDVALFRELNSVANQLGIARRLADPFREQGWELHFMDIKRMADKYMAMGVNMPGCMPSLATLTGNSKYLYNHSFSNHTRCHDEISVMSDYLGRLSLLLSSGEQYNKNLILIPSITAGCDSQPDISPAAVNRTADEFMHLLGLLDNEQIGYDLGNEAMIAAHGSVFNEFFVIGKREYNYVVIPQMMLSLANTTAGLLEQYMENGGVVLALCNPPRFIDGQASDRVKHLQETYPDQWLTMSGCNDPRLIHYLYSNDLIFTERQGDGLFHTRRELDDGQLLFFGNSSSTETCSASLICSGSDMAHINLFNGNIEQYPCVITDDIVSFDFTLRPAESILLFVGQHEIKGKSARTRRWNGDGVPLSTTGIAVSVKDENVLKLDFCRLITETDTSAFTYFTLAQQHLFSPRSIGSDTADHRQPPLRFNPHHVNSAFSVQYPFLADAQCRSKALRLVVEYPERFSVSLNGTPLQRLEGEWWLDRAFGVFSVEGSVVPGENIVELTGDTIPEHCVIQPVYLTGNIDVLPLDRGWLLAPAGQKNTGSWKAQGLPFYAGRVTYSTAFLMDDPGPVRVLLDRWSGTVATVDVNGIYAGVIIAPNRTLRLDKLVKRGSNTISITVTGSLNNLLRPLLLNGSRQWLTPVDLLNAPAEQPSGMQYDLDDDGLFDPFVVEVMR